MLTPRLLRRVAPRHRFIRDDDRPIATIDNDDNGCRRDLTIWKVHRDTLMPQALRSADARNDVGFADTRCRSRALYILLRNAAKQSD